MFVGCCGFCILFNVHGRGCVLCIIGGVATWMLYLLWGALGCDIYAANLFAALFAALYAEVMARVRKCPSMPYLVITILPLLPGAGVYYTMSLGLEGDMMDAVAKGLETIGVAGSLAVGYSVGIPRVPHPQPPHPRRADAGILKREKERGLHRRPLSFFTRRYRRGGRWHCRSG